MSGVFVLRLSKNKFSVAGAFFSCLLLSASLFAEGGGSRFTLRFPDTYSAGEAIELRNLASASLAILNESSQEYSRILGTSPKRGVTVELVKGRIRIGESFAPEWTSAVFYRGKIIIPTNSRPTMSELRRTLRHEYAHAVIAELSASRCPAWLDEGLAQYLEGEINPRLGPALRRLISSGSAFSLSDLREGFFSMAEGDAASAYAQSLFVTRNLINSSGFGGLRKYLRSLSKGMNYERAFSSAFGISQRSYERRLTPLIRRWAKSGRRNP